MTSLYCPEVPTLSRTPSGLYVPSDVARKRERPVAIDLFAGCGGFSCGFHQAGWQVAAALEFDIPAALTYLINLGRPVRYGGVTMHYSDGLAGKFEDAVDQHLGTKPIKGRGERLSASAQRVAKGEVVRPGMLSGDGWLSSMTEDDQRHGCEHFWLADVRQVTGAEILDALGMEPGEVSAVIGGPPCQGFSIAGKRDVMDPRNSLVFEFARLVTEIQPRTFVMENVPAIQAMVTPEGIPVVQAFCAALSDGGYGEYEALVRALGDTGGRAGIRDGRKPAKRRPRNSTMDEQLDLFADEQVSPA